MRSSQATFEIQEIPATGAYGVVCIARPTTANGELVAIKVLQLDQAAQENILRRARDEARMLSRLDHPNLVHVEPVLEIKGRPAVVMEYVRGVTVERLVRAFPEGMPALESLAIIQGAALGLEAAWSTPTGSSGEPMRIVHRDIKPGNLMVSVDGVVKVVDFGLAKASFDDREAQSRVFVRGSMGFMAPERYDGEDTPKGDVYALGLTLFQMMTGKKAVVSLRWDRHDEDMKKAIAHVTADDLPEPAVLAIRELIEAACLYEFEDRPCPGLLAEYIEQIFKLAASQPDLTSFAQRSVVPLYDSRTITPPTEHPSYQEVRFLEDEATEPAFDLNGEVRRLVLSAEFPTRANELASLLASHPKADIGPLLDVLDRANTPMWLFWRRVPDPRRTVAALHAVRGLHSDRVLNHAKRLAKHPNKTIAIAAHAVLAQH